MNTRKPETVNPQSPSPQDEIIAVRHRWHLQGSEALANFLNPRLQLSGLGFRVKSIPTQSTPTPNLFPKSNTRGLEPAAPAERVWKETLPLSRALYGTTASAFQLLLVRG